MRADRLTGDATEVAVVVVPAPRPVGQHGEVVVHARAARREERLEVDPARAVGLVGEELPRDGARELLGGLPVSRLDDAIRDERPEEERRRPAADDGEVVRPRGVVRREGDERQERADGERPGRDQARPTTARREQRHEPEDEEHLPDRPHEDEQRDAETQRGRTTGRRCFRYAHEENRDERERGGEQRVARELVEEEDVPGVREERGGRGQRGNRAEAARDAEPRGDRERVEGGDADLADDRAELEEHARDEPRSGRPREDRVRVDDVRVEELRVVEQVPRQVTTGLERERNRDRRVDAERDREDDGLGDRAFCKPHQGATDANDPASRGRHRARVLLLVDDPAGTHATVERRTRCPPPRPRSPSSSPA